MTRLRSLKIAFHKKAAHPEPRCNQGTNRLISQALLQLEQVVIAGAVVYF
jgi:hypothetical protein